MTSTVAPSNAIEPPPLWNARTSAGWADSVVFRETALRPIGDALLAVACLQAGERVVEIGSGAGDLACSMARIVGSGGGVVGMDISCALNDIARSRSAGMDNLRFETCDAQTAAPADAPFDRLVSRFGIMFFSDVPRAMANLRRLLRLGGRLDVAVWDSVQLNPWADVVLSECRRHLDLPPRQPRPTGAFVFSDRAVFRTILESAGFRDIEFRHWRGDLALGRPEQPLCDAARSLLPPGVVKSAFDNAPTATQAALLDDLATRLEPFRDANGLRMPAAVHIVSAVAGQGPSLSASSINCGRQSATE